MKLLLQRLGLAVISLILYSAPAAAQLYWAGDGGNPTTAGSGTWNNTNMQWSSTFPMNTPAVWLNAGTANFNGTAGGIVSILSGQPITVSTINFGTNAGAFALANSSTLSITGTGITNNSTNTQTIENVRSGLVFGATIFTNFATAGNATIINSGGSGTTTFADFASAGNATIINSGRFSGTYFTNSGTAADATITSSGGKQCHALPGPSDGRRRHHHQQRSKQWHALQGPSDGRRRHHHQQRDKQCHEF